MKIILIVLLILSPGIVFGPTWTEEGAGATVSAYQLDGDMDANNFRFYDAKHISTDILISTTSVTTGIAYVTTLDLGTNTIADTVLGYLLGWQHATDGSKLDGEDIYDDTIDDDSIDLTDVTMADFTDDISNTVDTEWDSRDEVEAKWAGTTTIWCDDNDGTGSGADADKLDGQEGVYYLRASSGAEIETNTTNIATNATNITALEVSTGANQANIATNATAITALEISTGTNQAGVATNVANITDIRKSTDINTGAASTPTKGDIMWFDGSNWAQLAKGTEDHVLTMAASDVVNWEAAAGGNLNDDKGIPANAFYRPAQGQANTAAIVREEIERTYRGLTSTDTIGWFMKLPDDKTGYTDYEGVWTNQDDGGAVNWEVPFVASGTSSGLAWIEVWISTSSGITWVVVESTTPVGNGWYDVRKATFPPTDFNLQDGMPYTARVRRNGDDSCPQTWYGKGAIPDWDKP